MPAYLNPSETKTTGDLCEACCRELPARSAFCPHCGCQLAYTSPRLAISQDNAQVIETVQELQVDLLAPSDYLLIRTRNSLYKFTLIEPVIDYGMLTGGTFGERQFHATLWRPANCQDAQSITTSLKLKIGYGLRFYLDEDKNAGIESHREMATSPIQQLTYITGGKATAVRPVPPELLAQSRGC